MNATVFILLMRNDKKLNSYYNQAYISSERRPPNMKTIIENLKKLLQKQIKHKQIFNIVISIQSGDNSFECSGAAGVAVPEKQTEMRVDAPYFIWTCQILMFTVMM